MAEARFAISRHEGELALLQDQSGAIRVAGPKPRGVEQFLNGRDPLDAIFLTQQTCADAGVSHALAAAQVLEEAAEISIPHNGRLLRDLLHMLSFMHAHLRNFYFQALPDYIPMEAMATYNGNQPELSLIGRAMGAKKKESWARAGFKHPFRQSQVTGIAENQARALAAISQLQRMMAVLGGKFPTVMSITPGGMTIPVSEALIIRLRGMLRELLWFSPEAPLEDGLTIVETMPELLTLGKSGEDFINAGTLGDDSGPDASLFPAGVLLNNNLAALKKNVTESIHSAFYRIPLAAKGRIQLLEEAPGKEGAYSWIKSPRYAARPLETGALARLIITYQAGSRSHTAPMVEQMGNVYGPDLDGANSVAGRMLARLGELPTLLHRCDSLLEQLTPGQPSLTSAKGRLLNGSAETSIESPAGTVQHRVVLEQGRIAHYDIVGASTWNGAPRTEDGKISGLERALNAQSIDLRDIRGLRQASRITHSYFFSATDAVQ